MGRHVPATGSLPALGDSPGFQISRLLRMRLERGFEFCFAGWKIDPVTQYPSQSYLQ